MLEFLEETQQFENPNPTPALPSTILNSAVIATFDPKIIGEILGQESIGKKKNPHKLSEVYP